MRDINYLELDITKNTVYEISVNWVNVARLNTLYVKSTCLEVYDKVTIIKSYDNFVQIAKKKHISIDRVTPVNDFLSLYWEQYIEDTCTANLIFDSIVIVFKEIEKRGLRKGYIGDTYLQQGYNLVSKYTNLKGYGNAIAAVDGYLADLKSKVNGISNGYYWE